MCIRGAARKKNLWPDRGNAALRTFENQRGESKSCLSTAGRPCASGTAKPMRARNSLAVGIAAPNRLCIF
jgi:hypothetical protein